MDGGEGLRDWGVSGNAVHTEGWEAGWELLLQSFSWQSCLQGQKALGPNGRWPESPGAGPGEWAGGRETE